MKITITETKEVEVKFLKVMAHPRYWEDSSVNGEEDTDGSLIPFRNGNLWEPIIYLATGKIENWPAGTTAFIHYKVCDEGEYHLMDANYTIVKSIDGYVPNILCPAEEGYGDYIIMGVDGEGQIADWKVDLKEFTEED